MAFALSAQSSTAADGKALFERHCAACHKKEGAGIAGLAPQLAKAEWAASHDADARRYLPLVVLNGLAGKLVAGGKTFMSVMPPQKQHSDHDIAALASYVMGTLNTPPGGWMDYTPDEIATLRAEKIDHQGLLALRAKLLE
jgi:mono/diheme cytochrome c family protein